MASARRKVATAGLVLVLAAGAYVTLDAHDLAPGPLTLAAPVADPSPFPTAPGATSGGAATPALTDLDAAAPLPQTSTVQAAVDALLTDSRIGTSVGVTVVDQLTGEVLGSAQPDSAHQPASTAKLVTAVGALATLDPMSTLSTRTVREGDLVVLVGGGDVMLGDGAGDPTVVDGRAGLGDLAAQTADALALAGITTIRLGFDDSMFTGATVSPGWDPSYVSSGFVAPVTALAVHIGKLDASQEYGRRYADPSLAAAKVFAQRLAERGITVIGTPSRTTAPGGALPTGEVTSAPLKDIVGYFLDTSDNTVTEAVSRLVALDQGLPASFDGGTAAVLHAVGTLGVDTTGAHLTDASGLASGSALPASLLAGIVRATTSADHPALRSVVAGLPIAGLTGTLFDRYTASDARGLVRAKTGSLPNVTSLAGTLVDADGRALVFAVLADATPEGGQDQPRRAIDAFVTGLAGCGCR
ncbi:MAG: D-alanyl-D-alanine carboxypeptidase/D-alanyl-D-alanine-endopeptidase [Actinobacteria bacterium]|nr:D-alanyl-D-alanine carboxypeptidase/D-alanyl-D-alanine-endopeptidase [Actinomycetota bacterium]